MQLLKMVLCLGVLLGLMSVCGPLTPARAEVRDLRLDLRGLRVARGAQSAMVVGVLTPSPAVSTPIEATLTLGGTRVALAGHAFRSGRFNARVRRVDLVAAGASTEGGRLHLTGVGIDEEVVIGADTCALASRATKRSCSCRTCPAPSAIVDVPDGTYAMGGPDFSGPALARLSTPDVGVRELRLLANVFDQAWLDVSSTFLLDGAAILGGDMVVPTLGSAMADPVAGGSRVVGVIESPSGSALRLSWPFTLWRPEDGTPLALGGSWRLDLFRSSGDLVGVMPLSLEVVADGMASPTSATLDGASSASDVYEVSGGECLVAPAGQLFCQLIVRTSTAVSLLRLQGALDLVTGSGQGEFYAGLPPSVTLQGTWIATRPWEPLNRVR